jgi:hypothetical protein
MAVVAEVADARQHMQALRRADKIRRARAQLKRRVGTGEVTAAEVLRAPPAEAATMALMELLTAQHRWGRHRVLRLLLAAGLDSPTAEQRKLGSLDEPPRGDALTARQRDLLAELLDRGK